MRIQRGSCGQLIAAVGFGGLIACAPAWATAVSYTVHPEQSALTLSGTWNGAHLWGRPAAGLQTSYSGTIQAELAEGTLQVTGADLDAATGERARPRALGRPGAQVADYAGFFRLSEPCLRGNLHLALRNVMLDMTSVPMTLSGGAFDAGLVHLTVDGSVDYAGAGLIRPQFGAGRAESGDVTATNAAVGTGSLTASGTLETLTMPVHATFAVLVDSPMAEAYDRFDFTLTGTIVATRVTSGDTDRPAPDVPEPATLAFMLLGVGVLGIRRRG